MEVRTDVSDAGIAVVHSETVVAIPKCLAVDGAVGQGNGEHGVVPVLVQLRLLNKDATTHQLSSGKALGGRGNRSPSGR